LVAIKFVARLVAALGKTSDNARVNSNYCIRHAQASDAPQLAVLAAQVWLHTYATQGVSAVIADYVLAELTPQAFAAKLDNPAVCILVAERDTHLLGLAVVQCNTPCAMATDSCVELATLYVQAAWKEHGIGSQLLRDAKALADGLHSALWLTVNAQNPDAISFYLRHRFQKVGTTAFVLGGVAHENLVLLGPTD
jgi:GNAT superfamily N-acetyltransferase